MYSGGSKVFHVLTGNRFPEHIYFAQRQTFKPTFKHDGAVHFHNYVHLRKSIMALIPKKLTNSSKFLISLKASLENWCDSAAFSKTAV